MSDIDDVIDALMKATDRRIWLCSMPPICQECGSVQVQLMDARAQPAQWRCRRCRVEFVHEPSKAEETE